MDQIHDLSESSNISGDVTTDESSELSPTRRKELDKAVKRAVEEYEDTLVKLAKDEEGPEDYIKVLEKELQLTMDAEFKLRLKYNGLVNEVQVLSASTYRADRQGPLEEEELIHEIRRIANIYQPAD